MMCTLLVMGSDVCWEPSNTQIFKVVYHKGLVREKVGGSLNNIW